MLSTVDYGRSGFMEVGRGPDGLELKVCYLANALEHNESRSKRFPCLPISSKHSKGIQGTGGPEMGTVARPGGGILRCQVLSVT